jgi:sugar phosphate permease
MAFFFGVKESPGQDPLRPEAKPASLRVTPRLIAIAVMYFFVKATRYAFLFWLPLYMTEGLHYEKSLAGYASSVYELVGFAGVLGAGYASENWFRGQRFLLGAILMGALSLLCVLYPMLNQFGLEANLVMIGLIGIFTFGPDTLMAGAAVQDVSDPKSTAWAGGFVNGCGSVGQILSPLIVSGMSSRFGWQAMFSLLGFACFLGGAALLVGRMRKV